MLELFNSLIASEHPEEVKNKFIVLYIKGLNKNSSIPKEGWEQLCGYAYGLITESRVSTHGEVILFQVAHLEKSVYMLYFSSSWINQTLSDANNVPSYRQLRALIKIIKYKQEVASANDTNDVENDCQLLKSYAIKYIVVVKSRIDWLQLFVSMFTDLPQSVPEDHVRLIEILVHSLALPEDYSIESYNEFVEKSVNLIESLWQKNKENVDTTIFEVFKRLSSNQACSKSIVLLISKIPKLYISAISLDVQNSAGYVNKFEICIERMIPMIPHQFANEIGCWIIKLHKALDKTTLIRVVRANAAQCFEYLLDRHSRNDALMVIEYFLLEMPDIFDSIVPTFSKVLETVAQEGDQDTLSKLSKIAQSFMKKFPRGGNKYLQLSKTLKSLNLPELTQDEISDTLRRSTRFKGANVAGGRKEVTTKTPVYSTQSPRKKKGLQNLGNTCFMNSVLQALFNSMEFRNRILQTATTKSKTPTIYQLQMCFARMTLSTESYLSPSALLETLPKWLNNGRQQDCHEFLKILFSQIEDESKKSKKYRQDLEEEKISTTHEDMTNIPICPFGGKLENTIECLTCGYKSKTREEFHDLSLSLKVDSPDNLSFSDLLSEFLSSEDLKGDNQYYCEECGGLRDARKFARIIVPPRYLILSLNRFEYDVKYAKRIKIMTHVSIQDSLSVMQVHDDESHTSHTESNYNMNGQVNGKINGIINGETDEKQYNLSAIVIHSGSSAEYGHYYTYAKDEEDGKWYNYNDSYVSISTLPKIVSEGEDFKSDTPYLLFFQQKNVINHKLSEISQSLIKEVEEVEKRDDMDKEKDKNEDNPLSGYDLFDFDNSVF